MKRSLTRPQAAELLRAASVLPHAQRDAFLCAVDGHLVGIRRQLTDDDVNAAIVTVLADASITTTSHFMCDSAPPRRPTVARKNYEIFDRRGNRVDDDINIIPDGGKLRVSMMARDGLSDIQRGVIADKAARFDDSQARHQPGPVYCDRSAARAAYEDAKRELGEAWRAPAAATAAAAASILPRGQQPGDTCTVREGGVAEGSPGHLRMVGGKLVCVPDRQDAAPAVPHTMTTDEARKIRKAAYDAMVADMRGAWRDPAP